MSSMKAEEQPEDIAAELGMDIGTVKGRLRVADLSPVSILAAVTTREGFGRPRLSGLVYVGLSAVCASLSVFFLVRGHLVYVILPLVPVYLLSGVWLIVFGQPEAVPRPKMPPWWARVGLGACLTIGVIAGVLADAWLVFGR